MIVIGGNEKRGRTATCQLTGEQKVRFTTLVFRGSDDTITTREVLLHGRPHIGDHEIVSNNSAICRTKGSISSKDNGDNFYVDKSPKTHINQTKRLVVVGGGSSKTGKERVLLGCASSFTNAVSQTIVHYKDNPRGVAHPRTMNQRKFVNVKRRKGVPRSRRYKLHNYRTKLQNDVHMFILRAHDRDPAPYRYIGEPREPTTFNVINEHLHAHNGNSLVKHEKLYYYTNDDSPITVGGKGDCWTFIPIFEKEEIDGTSIPEHDGPTAPWFDSRGIFKDDCEDDEVSHTESSEHSSDDSDYDSDHYSEDGSEGRYDFVFIAAMPDGPITLDPNEPIEIDLLIEILEYFIEEEWDNVTDQYVRGPYWALLGDAPMLHLVHALRIPSDTPEIDFEYVDLPEMLEILKEEVEFYKPKCEKVYVGAPNTNTIINRNDEAIVSELGDAYNTAYTNIVDNHDLRVVRLYYSSQHKHIIKAPTPSRAVRDHFQGLTNFTIQTYDTVAVDNDFNFNFTLACCIAYSMVTPVAYSADENVSRVLSKQPNFKLDASDASFLITTDLALEDLNQYDLIYLIAPAGISGQSGNLRLDIGGYIKLSDSTLYYPKSSTTTCKVEHMNPIFEGSKTTYVEGSMAYCIATHVVGGFCIYVMTSMEHTAFHADNNMIRTFEIPVFESWVLSDIGLNRLTIEKHEINLNLLNRVMNRNITNTVSDEKMVEYMMALSWYSYNKRGVEIASVKVTPEMAKTHLYLAKGLLLREHIANTITEAMLTKASLGRWAVATISAAIGASKFAASEQLTTIIEWAERYINVPHVRDSADKVVMFWDSLDVWRSSSVVSITGKNSNRGCSHHGYCPLENTGVPCSHCNFMTADAKTLFCDCCNSHAWVCGHVCDVIHVGDKNCNCCGKLTMNVTVREGKDIHICDCCSLTPTSTAKEQARRIPTKKISDERAPREREDSKQKKKADLSSYNFGDGHTHTCEKCDTSFACKCVTPIVDGKRRRPDNSCPFCESNVKNKPLYSKVTEEGIMTFDLLTSRQYMHRLTPNTVTTLLDGTLDLHNYNVRQLRPNLIAVPFLTKGTHSVDDFVLSNHRTAGPADCGFEALEHYLTATMTETAVLQLTKKTGNFSAEDLASVCKKYETNCIIITSVVNVHIHVVSDEYAVFAHAVAFGEEINHWYVCDIKRTNDIIPYGSLFNTVAEHNTHSNKLIRCNYGEATREQQLNISFNLASATDAAIGNTMPFVKLANGILYNCDNVRAYGDIRFKVHHNLLTVVECMLKSIKNKQIDDALAEPYSSTSNTNMLDKLVGEARASAFDIVMMFLKPTRNSSVVNTQPMHELGKHYINIPNVKRGDLITYNHKGAMTSVVVAPQNGKVSITNRTSIVTYYKYKASLSSLLLKIQSINNALINGIVSKPTTGVQLYGGPGGSGKTTKAISYAFDLVQRQRNAKIIGSAMSSDATDELRKRLLSKLPQENVDVFTVEKLTTMGKIDCDLFILDEASMVADWQFYLLCVRPNQYIIIGDSGQIGVEDFNTIGGTRELSSCIDHFSTVAKIEESWDVKRYGNPLAKELAVHPALRKLVSSAVHNTSVHLHWSSSITPKLITDKFNGCDVIICFYNAHVDLLKKIIDNRNIVITTAAKYQSKEADHIGVLQSPLFRGDTILPGNGHMNFSYCYSAATRARQTLTWLSVACYNDDTTLAGRLGIRVGSFYKCLGAASPDDVEWNWNLAYRQLNQTKAVIPAQLPPRVRTYVAHASHNQVWTTLGFLPLNHGKSQITTAQVNALITHSSAHRWFFALDPSPWYTANSITGQREGIDHIGLCLECNVNGMYLTLFINYNYFNYCYKMYTNTQPSMVEPHLLVRDVNHDAIIQEVNAYSDQSLISRDCPSAIHLGTISCWAIVTMVKNHSSFTNTLTYDQYKHCIVPFTVGYMYPEDADIIRAVSNDVKIDNWNVTNMYHCRALHVRSINRQIVRTCAIAAGFFRLTQSSEGDVYEVQAVHSLDPLKAQVGVRIRGSTVFMTDSSEACCALLMCIMNAKYTLKIMGKLPDQRIPVLANKNLQLERTRALRALSDMTIPIPHCNDITKLDFHAFVADFVLIGREMNSSLQIAHSVKNGVHTFKMSASVAFISGSRSVSLNQDNSVHSTELGRTKTAQFVRAVSAYCYENTGTFTHTSIPMKISKKYVYRVRLIAYLCKVYNANNEQYTVQVGDYMLKFKTSYTGCAACTAVYVELNGQQHIITADYNFADRYISGTYADIIHELIHEPVKFRLVPDGFDDRNFSLSLLTERVYGWWQQMFTVLSYMQYLRDHKYSNINTITRVFEELQVKVRNVEYDDMTPYPFWNFSKRKASVIVNDKRQTVDLAEMLKNATQTEIKNMYILESLANLNAAQGSNKISKLISMVYMSKVGAMDRLPGMRESIAWHKTNRTATANTLIDRATQASVMALALESKTHPVPHDVVEYATSTLKFSDLMSNNLNNMGDVADQATDVVVLLSIKREYPLCSIAYHGTTSYASVLDQSICMIDSDHNAAERLRVMMNLPTLISMCEKYMGNLTVDDPRYAKLNTLVTDHVLDASKCNVVYYNGNVFRLTHEQIVVTLREAMIKYEHVYVFMPLVINRTADSCYLQLTGSSIVNCAPKSIIDLIENGDNLFDDVKLHTINILPNGALMRLDRSPWVDKPVAGKQYFIVKLPKLITQPSKIISMATLLEFTDYAVDVAFYNNMERRAMGGATLRDLQIQARTMVNVGQFTTSTVANKYKVNVATASQCALFAYIRAKAFDSKFSTSSIVTTESPVLGTAKVMGLGMLANVFDSVPVDTDMDKLIDLLGEHLPANLLFDMLRKTLDNLRVMSLPSLGLDRRIKYGDNRHELSMTVKVRASEDNLIYTSSVYYDSSCERCARYTKSFRAVESVGLNLFDCEAKGALQIKHPLCEHDGVTLTTHDNKNLTNDGFFIGDRMFDQSCSAFSTPHLTDIRLVATADKNLLTYADIVENSRGLPPWHCIQYVGYGVDLTSVDILTDFVGVALFGMSQCDINISRVAYEHNGQYIRLMYNNKLFVDGTACKGGSDGDDDNTLLTVGNAFSARLSYNSGSELHMNINSDSTELHRFTTACTHEPALMRSKIISACATGPYHTRYHTTIWQHIIGHSRWGSNVNPFHGNQHWLSNRVVDVGSLNIEELKFLHMIIETVKRSLPHIVDHNGDPVDDISTRCVHIYAIETTMGRTLFHDCDGSDVSIVIGGTVINDNSVRNSVHFNRIQVETDSVGRVNAALRLVLGILYNGKSTQFHEGQPHFGTYFCESYAYQLAKRHSAGVTVTWTEKIGTPIGHTVWVGQPNWDDGIAIIKTCIAYGHIYGADECHYNKWPVTRCFTMPGSHLYHYGVSSIVLRNVNWIVQPIPNDVFAYGVNLDRFMRDFESQYGLYSLPSLNVRFDHRWRSISHGRLVDECTPPLNDLWDTNITSNAGTFLPTTHVLTCNNYAAGLYFDYTPNDDDGSTGGESHGPERQLSTVPNKPKDKDDGASSESSSDDTTGGGSSSGEPEFDDENVPTGQGKYCGLDACPKHLRLLLYTTLYKQLSEQRLFAGWFESQELTNAFSAMGYEFAAVYPNDHDERPASIEQITPGMRPTVVYYNSGGVHWHDGQIIDEMSRGHRDIAQLALELEMTSQQIMDECNFTDSVEVRLFNITPTLVFNARSPLFSKVVFALTTDSIEFIIANNELTQEQIVWFQSMLGGDCVIDRVTKELLATDGLPLMHYLGHVRVTNRNATRSIAIGLNTNMLPVGMRVHTSVDMNSTFAEFERKNQTTRSETVQALNDISKSKFNPNVNGTCIRECVLHALNSLALKEVQLDVDAVNFNLGEFAQKDQLFGIMYYLNINCIVLDNMLGTVDCNIINMGYVVIFSFSVPESAAVGHCVVADIVDYNEFTAIFGFLITKRLLSHPTPHELSFGGEVLALDKMVDQLVEMESAVLSGNSGMTNWMQRLNGRADIVASKRRNALTTNALKCGSFCKVDLRPNMLYLYRHDNKQYNTPYPGFNIMITCEDGNGDTFCLAKHSHATHVIDIGCSAHRVARKEIVKSHDVNAGMLNAESMSLAERNRLECAGLSLNRDATQLYVVFYDGVSHHFRPDRDAIIQCLESEHRTLIFPGISNSSAIRSLIQSGGPMVPKIVYKQVSLVTGCADDRFRSISRLCTPSGVINHDKLFADAASLNYALRWKLDGNRWAPCHGKIEFFNKEDNTKIRVAGDNADNARVSIITTTARNFIRALATANDRRHHTLPGSDNYDAIVEHINSIFEGWSQYDFKILDEFNEINFTNNNVLNCVLIHIDTTNNYIVSLLSGQVFAWSRVGKGTFKEAVDEIIVINDETNTTNEMYKGKFDKVFGKVMAKEEQNQQGQYVFSDEHKSTIQTLDVLNNSHFSDWQVYPELVTDNSGNTDLYVGNGKFDCPINVEILEMDRSPKVINFVEDNTAMVDNELPLPNNNINLRGGELITGLVTVKKGMMVEYPTNSQPNYTKRAGAAFAATSTLFGTKLVLRKVEHDPVEDANDFIQVYSQPGAINALPQVNIDAKETLEWLRERPGASEVVKDCIEVIENGLDIVGMDKVNQNLKVEARLKDVMLDAIDEWGMPDTIPEQRVRLIVWQRKGITAIFAPFFATIKEHLKRILRSNVVYADGLTPMQISELFKRIPSKGVRFAEDDLAKQDRQTDMTLIKTEMEIYKRLGGNPAVVDLWETVHHKWRAKGCGYKFSGDACRHTGQATTAIGNAIVNLVVKKRLVREMGSNLLLMIILGDDNLIVTKSDITAEQITQQSALHFNMSSKAEVSTIQGGFLRMIAYKDEKSGNLGVGPDIVRLRRKHETLNGVSEANDINILMRSLSYCCMVGLTPETHEFVQKSGYDVKLQSWYSWSSLRTATAAKYKTTEAAIDNQYALLMKTITDNKVFINEQLMFTSVAA